MTVHKPLILTGGQVARLPDGDSIETGQPNLSNSQTILVTSTLINIDSYHIQLDANSNQTLRTINGAATNDLIYIRGLVGMSRVTVKTGGNIAVKKNRKIESPFDVLVLLNIGGAWTEVSWNG